MELAPKKICTGCMSCVYSCPQHCITESEDILGHLYPQIEQTKCMSCGKCQRACPEITKVAAHKSEKAYAAWSLDVENRKTSASGGAASTFYQKAIEDGFWIVGAQYNDDFSVVHTVSNEMASIRTFKQSKYVYSEMGVAYQHIKKLLLCGEHVVFISLPCKVAGLLGYLGGKTDNLITVDIVCHGTPSYKNLREHISSIVKGKSPADLKFRQDNEFEFLLLDQREKPIYNRVGRTDSYLAAFLEGLNYRESCYYCSYAKPERISDITICDFWGLGQDIPFNYPYSGAISAVLINTKMGMDFFESCKPCLFAKERPVDEAIKGNAQLNMPTAVHPKRAEFEKEYVKQGFESAVSSCLGNIMKSERKRVRKQKRRAALRKTAGVFIKRYRG